MPARPMHALIRTAFTAVLDQADQLAETAVAAFEPGCAIAWAAMADHAFVLVSQGRDQLRQERRHIERRVGVLRVVAALRTFR